MAGEIETWIKQDLPDAVYWVERTNSRRGYKRICVVRFANRRGAGAARAFVRRSAQRNSDQCDAGEWNILALGSAGGSEFDYFSRAFGLTQSRGLTQLNVPGQSVRLPEAKPN